MREYQDFLKLLDKKLDEYFKSHASLLCCKKRCSVCCERGDYPISELELKYLMQGFLSLENELKSQVQDNFKNIKKGGTCPFLINKECSIYPYRPIVCRVHGLAYLLKNRVVKLPYCTNEGKNYSNLYKNGEFIGNPIEENLETHSILKDFDFGTIKNLYDWIIKS